MVKFPQEQSREGQSRSWVALFGGPGRPEWRLVIMKSVVKYMYYRVIT